LSASIGIGASVEAIPIEDDYAALRREALRRR